MVLNAKRVSARPITHPLLTPLFYTETVYIKDEMHW